MSSSWKSCWLTSWKGAWGETGSSTSTVTFLDVRTKLSSVSPHKVSISKSQAKRLTVSYSKNIG